MIMMPRVPTAADVKESAQAAAMKTCRFESRCSWLVTLPGKWRTF